MTRPRVLLVEDEALFRMSVAERLRRSNPGFEVLEAEHGAEALAISKDHPPDCIVTDVAMPVMDGVELLVALHNRRAHSGVVVMTAFAVTQPFPGAPLEILDKPLELGRLHGVIMRAIDSRGLLTVSAILHVLAALGRSDTLRVQTVDGAAEGRMQLRHGAVARAFWIDREASSAAHGVAAALTMLSPSRPLVAGLERSDVWPHGTEVAAEPLSVKQLLLMAAARLRARVGGPPEESAEHGSVGSIPSASVSDPRN